MTATGRSYIVSAKERDLAPAVARAQAKIEGFEPAQTLYVSERMNDGTYEVVLAEPERPMIIVSGNSDAARSLAAKREQWAKRRAAHQKGIG